MSPRKQSFGTIQESRRFAAGSAGTDVHPAVAPKPREVVVTKHRVSAFAGTDLDMILRANGVETLVVAGIATTGPAPPSTRRGTPSSAPPSTIGPSTSASVIVMGPSVAVHRRCSFDLRRSLSYFLAGFAAEHRLTGRRPRGFDIEVGLGILAHLDT